MSPYFVDPIPPKKFLDSFLPKDPHLPFSSTFEPGILSGLKDTDSEADMYTKFSQIVSPYLSGESGLNLVNKSCIKDEVPHPMFPFLCQPDCYVYEANSGHNHPDSSLVECLIEFKTTSDYDPFVLHVPSEPMSPSMGRNPFMSRNSQGRKMAGQITAHATLILGAQYRTHIFLILILILREYSRIIRWDRGGAVVTAPIYHDEGHILDFLIQFKDASPQARGHDTTVEPASDKEQEEAREVKELADATSLLSLSIPDRSSSHHRYIVEAPRPRLDIPAGRWTRVSIAYDVQRQKRVLLKDSWRAMLEGVTPEGEIYARLHKHSVPNIPSCSQAGDVGNESYHASRTHEFGDSALKPYRHYRLVLDTIGRPLETFNRSHELVKAVYDALLAHEAAYKAGILHRDISPGNIMIVDDKDEPNVPGGILIDWDLCKSVSPEDEDTSARQNSRTGTWPFMAADIVASPNVVHTFIHDVESAFWVLIWMTCSYLPISWDIGYHSSFMQETMCPKIYLDTGGENKLAFIVSKSRLDSFTIIENGIFTRFLRRLMRVLGVRHLSLPEAPDEFDLIIHPKQMDARILEYRIKEHNKAMDLLKNHTGILSMFERALQSKDWPEHDGAKLQPTVMPNFVPISMWSRSKQSGYMAEENNVFV